MSLLELKGKLTPPDPKVKNANSQFITRHDPKKIKGSWTGDPFFRKCPICHKVYSIFKLGANNNRTPCHGVLIIG